MLHSSTIILEIIFWVGVLIFVHELGHFIAAKSFKVKVEQFSLGFPPKLWGFKKGETEYLISWIPLGGYVKMSGGEILEQDKKIEPWDFLARPWWQRIIVCVAGPLMNFVLAFLLFIFVAYIGIKIPNYSNRIGEIKPKTSAFTAHLKEGDLVMEANGKAVADWHGLEEALRPKEEGEIPPAVTLKMKRDKRVWTVQLKPEFDKQYKEWSFGLESEDEDTNIVGSVTPGFPADQAGMKAGDRIVEINSKKIRHWSQISELIHGAKGGVIKMKVARNGKVEKISVKTVLQDMPGVGKAGFIGVGRKEPDTFTYMKFSLTESIGMGARGTMMGAQGILRGLWQMVSGQISFQEAIGGPVTIVRMANQQARQGWRDLLDLIAMIGVMLAVINLLPIPLTDGGLVVLFLLEAVRRKPLSVKVQDIYQRVGFVFIVTLMLYATYNDVFKLIKAKFFPMMH
jgi:regulator of sigma E protease